MGTKTTKVSVTVPRHPNDIREIAKSIREYDCLNGSVFSVTSADRDALTKLVDTNGLEAVIRMLSADARYAAAQVTDKAIEIERKDTVSAGRARALGRRWTAAAGMLDKTAEFLKRLSV